MTVTAFLSMWINNSAATSIMIPAAVAIIDELRTHRQEIENRSTNKMNLSRRISKDIVPNQSTGLLLISSVTCFLFSVAN